jgi:hypothetical protein
MLIFSIVVLAINDKLTPNCKPSNRRRCVVEDPEWRNERTFGKWELFEIVLWQPAASQLSIKS